MNKHQIIQKICSDQNISDRAYRVFSYIQSYKSGVKYSTEEISKALKIPVDLIDKDLRLLGEHGYIQVNE